MEIQSDRPQDQIPCVLSFELLKSLQYVNTCVCILNIPRLFMLRIYGTLAINSRQWEINLLECYLLSVAYLNNNKED